jgi:hypothetical protein|tara:strand:+ start:322 stop:513 length:192 start_codon:yes stop_codon:yes gene_type:complete
MKRERTIKDVVKNARWNWYGEGEEESTENNCYKGKFWDMETMEFLRWNELIKEGKSTERKSTE